MNDLEVQVWRTAHAFGEVSASGERGTWRVIWLTSAMMVVEIVSGWAFGSMALLADGWHMASHAGALLITAFTYSYQRRHAGNVRFSFGTGKVGSLGGFASAVALGLVAVIMAWESAWRLFHPEQISFNQAIGVAALGLAVNLASAWLLGHDGHEHHSHDTHDHDDHHDHDHEHGHGHDHARGRAHHLQHDHNLKAAYLHVLADALTSVTAIVALLAGKYAGWVWMDPLMGIVGSLVIGKWSLGLLKQTGKVLLDYTQDFVAAEEIAAKLEAGGGVRVTDLHLWHVASGHMACIVALRSESPRTPDEYKAALSGVRGLSHVTVEVNPAA